MAKLMPNFMLIFMFLIANSIFRNHNVRTNVSTDWIFFWMTSFDIEIISINHQEWIYALFTNSTFTARLKQGKGLESDVMDRQRARTGKLINQSCYRLPPHFTRDCLSRSKIYTVYFTMIVIQSLYELYSMISV